MSTITVRGSTKVGIASIVRNTIFGDASPVLDDVTEKSRDTIQNISDRELMKTRYCW